MAKWLSFVFLSDLLGVDVAEDFCREHGGVSLRCPVRASEEHYLAKSVGVEGLEKLCFLYGGEVIALPLAARTSKKEEILNRLMAGESKRHIARSLAVTERWVNMVSRGLSFEHGRVN